MECTPPNEGSKAGARLQEADGKLTRDARSTSDPRARSAYLDAKAEGGTKEGPGRAVERGTKKKPPLAPPATPCRRSEPSDSLSEEEEIRPEDHTQYQAAKRRDTI